MAERKLGLACRIVLSRANSTTARTRLIAAIWPSRSAALSLAAVMSVANFTTLLGRPAASSTGL